MKTNSINKKHIIAFIILMMIPLAATAAAMFFLPDTIAVHFGANGAADRFGSKYEMFILPASSVILGTVILIAANRNPKDEKSKKNEKYILITGECCLAMLAVFNIYLLYISFTGANNLYSQNPEIGDIECTLFGLYYIIMGNYLPKVKMNSLIGFRCSWTMKNDDIWKKSQHFAGIAMIINGVLLIIAKFFMHGMALLLILLGSALVMLTADLIYAYKISHIPDNEKD